MGQARDINGVGVGVVALGVVVGWAGIRNVPLVEAFKDLAMGRTPTPRPKTPFQAVSLSLGGAAGPETAPLTPGSGSGIVAMAQQVAASSAGRANYCWGGGHSSNPCSAKCFDCSGFVSCVLNRMGLLKGSLVTTQFLAWKGAVTVPFEQRQPGDLLVNTGHMGIVVDNTQMINAACTACGPVKLSPYSARYTVRRVRQGTAPGGGRRVVPV